MLGHVATLPGYVKGAWCDSSLGFLGPFGLQQVRGRRGTKPEVEGLTVDRHHYISRDNWVYP